MSAPAKVPPRKGSIGQGQASQQAKALKRKSSYDSDLLQVGKRVHEGVKKLRSNAAFDVKYLDQVIPILEDQKIVNRLQSQSSRSSFHSEETWISSNEYREYDSEDTRLSREIEIFTEQRHNLTRCTSSDRDSRRIFVKLFTTSQLGWALPFVQGQRPNEEQSAMRSALISQTGRIHPNNEDYLWCAITKRFIYWKICIAAHIYPWRHGQELMTLIFDTQNEMFDMKNSMLMSEDAETRFDLGLIALVPNIEGASTDKAIKAWLSAGTPKAYRIQTFTWDKKKMESVIPWGEYKGLRWNQLDGKAVDFKSDHRPRARYLYFHYLFCVFRYLASLPERQMAKPNALVNQLGKPCWASPGKYITKSFLLGFIEEVGAKYGDLVDDLRSDIKQVMEHALDNEETVSSDPGLVDHFVRQGGKGWREASLVDSEEEDEEMDSWTVDHILPRVYQK